MVFAGASKLKNLADVYFDVGPDGRLLFRNSKGQVEIFDPRDKKTETHDTLHPSALSEALRWSPDGQSIAYVVPASREGDAAAGLWVDDFKGAPRQVFRGWVYAYARGPHDEIYLIEGKPDLNGVLWKLGWNGQGLGQTSTIIRMIDSYWVEPGQNSGDDFGVSPDGRHLAFDLQTVLGANFGMIENVR